LLITIIIESIPARYDFMNITSPRWNLYSRIIVIWTLRRINVCTYVNNWRTKPNLLIHKLMTYAFSLTRACKWIMMCIHSAIVIDEKLQIRYFSSLHSTHLNFTSMSIYATRKSLQAQSIEEKRMRRQSLIHHQFIQPIEMLF
jgi:hypothetical protein